MGHLHFLPRVKMPGRIKKLGLLHPKTSPRAGSVELADSCFGGVRLFGRYQRGLFKRERRGIYFRISFSFFFWGGDFFSCSKGKPRVLRPWGLR